VRSIQADLAQFKYNYEASLDIPEDYHPTSKFETDNHINVPNNDTTLVHLYNTQEEVSHFFTEDYISEPEYYFTEEEDLVGSIGSNFSEN
ncbi:hypothetical protein KI387_026238, partial [Taxus chinensis]